MYTEQPQNVDNDRCANRGEKRRIKAATNIPGIIYTQTRPFHIFLLSRDPHEPLDDSRLKLL